MPFIALVAALLLVAADQIIKYFISLNLKPVGSVSVIDNLFSLSYVENRGVAFGMFEGMRWLFIALTAVFIAGIIFYMFKNRPDKKIFYVSSALIIGGGIGNLIDRVIYGYVIDYLSLSFFSPVCNFADYCITIGVILLAVYAIFMSDGNKIKKDRKND